MRHQRRTGRSVHAALRGPATHLFRSLLPHAERRTLAGQTHDVAADALAPALSDFFSAKVRV